MKQVRITIEGNVQGVFFRAFIKEHAKRLNLKGYVRNTEDGGVEVVAQGAEEQVRKLVELCRKGPEGSEVDKITVEDQELSNLPEFSISR